MKKSIKIGTLAPTIQATDIWDNEIHVPLKNQWIYLSFHRFAACPFCNLRTNELIKNYDKFKKQNIEIVSLWPSEKDVLLRYAGKEKTPFPMVSDKNKTIYRDYGVTKSSFVGGVKLLLKPQLIVNALKNNSKNIKIDTDPKLMPAAFLIDPNGSIKMAYYGKHYGDHPKIESILQYAI